MVVVGCTKPAPAPTPEPGPGPTPPAPEWEWPSVISMCTDAPGGLQHTGIIAWAAVFEAMTGTKVRVTPESGEVTKREWLRDGRFDFVEQMLPVYGNHWMMPNYEDAKADNVYFPLGIVWGMPADLMGFLVRGDSDIKTLYDIKGHKIAKFTPAQAPSEAIDALVAWAQLAPEDVEIVPFASFEANMMSVAEGKADVAFGSTGASFAVRSEAAPHGIRWLDLDPKKDPEGAARFLAVRGSWPFVTVTAGVKSAIGVTSLLAPSLLLGTKDSDPQLVYHMAKWLNENYDAYKGKNINCERMSPELFRIGLDFTYLPVHEGTIKYLKEIGMWTEADDARQEYNVDLIERHIEAYNAALAEARKLDIRVDPSNADWIKIVAKHIEALPKFGVHLD